MDRRVRWLVLAAGLAACLAVSYGAYTLATYSWNQVVDYRGPYLKKALPAAEAAPDVPDLIERLRSHTPPRRRVVYVIIDGLRLDTSRGMPAINVLRRSGYDAVVRTSQPSLSFPNWTNLMSGAPQRISGVTTNWYEERVKVETLVDVALREQRVVAVSAPKDFEMLYGVKRTGHVFLRDWTEDEYMTGDIVDNAISLADESSATLVLVHFPDVDEAGHRSGGASKDYVDTAMRVDKDLARLIGALKDDRTTFVVTADHGHIDTGGHGGWESVVTSVPAVFSGPGVPAGTGTGVQEQVAPTVAYLAELPVPRHAAGMPLFGADQDASGRFAKQQLAAYTAWRDAVGPEASAPSPGPTGIRAAFDAATDARLAAERAGRLPVAIAVALAALLAVVAVGMLSWRALLSALAGTVAYYVVYDGAYFLVHRYGLWSLSSFNSESLLKGFMNTRMLEAALGGIVGVLAAAFVYAAIREAPKRAAGEYLAGWLSLGPATVLVVQATLALQVAWYVWRWGSSVSWSIPDLMWGFKYDLDLIQLTALGAAALLSVLLTFLVGRYHPRGRHSVPAAANEATPAS